MTTTTHRGPAMCDTRPEERFRLKRAGVLNVWQYDDQVFDFADGRLLLRGANGAGKSKTMEMLLPFVIDGDKARLTASGRHHTSLLWLMLDGYDGSARTGYLWVEFGRTTPGGEVQHVTCGVGLRATQSARAVSAWFFTTSRRVGHDLDLDGDSGPLSQGALAALLQDGSGHVFGSGRRYREHVAGLLFGLGLDQYESLLRLIYWLRQPQVGEDIDPARLAEQLVNALPFVDPETISSAGTTFDELEAFGEEIERRARSAESLTAFAETYARYARSVVATRGRSALAAGKAVRDARRALRQATEEREQAQHALADAAAVKDRAEAARDEASARIRALESSPEARSRAGLIELAKRVEELARQAETSAADVARAQGRARASRAEVDLAATRLGAALRELRVAADTAVTSSTGAGVEPPLPPAAAAFATTPVWDVADHAAEAERLRSIGSAHASWVDAGRTMVGQALAAVQVVHAARLAAGECERQAAAAQAAVDDRERRLDGARHRHAEAAEKSRAAEGDLLARLSEWRDAEGSVPMTLPELTAPGLASLAGLAADAAAPTLRALSEDRAEALARQGAARTALAGLRTDRQELEDRVDPVPPAPGWHRDRRDDEPGAPLWRLVDVRAGVDEAARAGLEAALEGAGLLDAWVRPDGSILAADHDDVALVAGGVVRPVGAGSTLTRWLEPVALVDSPVPEVVIAGVLASVGALVDGDGVPSGDDATHGHGQVAVGADGRWVAGPAQGRTSKPVAQYLGASARAAERARRIGGVDRRIEEEEQAEAAAQADLTEADRRRERIAAWVIARPAHEGVLRAWTREETLGHERTRAEAEVAEATESARDAREAASRLHSELLALGERHALPVTAAGLVLRREQLLGARASLDDVLVARDRLDGAANGWRDSAARAVVDRDDEDRFRARRAADRAAHDGERERLEELRRIAGAEIADLEERLADQRRLLAEVGLVIDEQTRRREELLGAVGTLEHAEETADARVRESEPVREAAFDAFLALHVVPGLLAAAAIGADPGAPPPDAAEVRRLTESAEGGPRGDVNDVLQAMTGLQSSPAATVEPRLVDVDGVHAAVGRADRGDLPLTELTQRLTDSVAADRELLTERERDLFEKHILGQLGDALRAVRRQAEELVAAMSDQLRTVSTSQGIRVRLRWRLRDDIPTDARRAVELLGQPVGALLADERAELRDALHRLIELSRSEAPEDSYTEHLGRALDYRQWFAFTVQYHRPEAGQWRDLQRRTALSQGEQKVLCYLPLFAAAAAHFTSLAGAAPHAPRFVLLDDAFPKIDARTHPLLFGLLVDLDLDFVVTSERLWGTHPTVPSLAIYEALRNPNERGIAQFEHRWDGHHLLAVSADG